MCPLQINIIIIDFQLRVGVGWFTTQVGPPRSFSFYLFYDRHYLRSFWHFRGRQVNAERGCASYESPPGLRHNQSPTYPLSLCQYSVFITAWIQSMRGTTVRDGLRVICCTKHVALWDWFNARKARIITRLLCFLLPLSCLRWSCPR